MVRRVLLLCLPLSLLLATVPAIAAQAGIVSVDYVIGMVKAGLEQDAIIEHILKNKLAFRLSEGSLERLREAGAGEDLLKVVGERAASALEGWERPRRLGEYGDIWSGNGEEEEDVGGAVSYGGYVYFGPWYGFYPGIYAYSFYDPFGIYYPYYRPYSYYSYYYPYHRYPHVHRGHRGQAAHPGGYRTSPRGSPSPGRLPGGGRTRTAPRGSH